ncbi:MAG: DUF1838 family protein [Proteobacteria bacterium]|nr:DUF1838 family protein [Pseudomonadota bacterium]
MQSQLISHALLGRRSALALLASGASVVCLGTGSATARSAAPASVLDLSDPLDNLYAFGKIWSGYDAPVIGAFHGLMYARIPGRRAVPLFNYVGTGILQAKIAENGDLMIKSRETGYFTDLQSGEILEYWQNPFTDETVEVYHFYNELLGGRIGQEIPQFLIGGDHQAPTLMNAGTAFPDSKGKYPFRLPYQQFGDDGMVSWDYAHEHTNPVTPAGWPSYSTGAKIAPSEHFTFNFSRRALDDRSLPTVRTTAGFTRLSEPWPFMRMGKAPAALREMTVFGRMFSHKGLPSVDEVPTKLLAYVEKHAPEYLTLPSDWPARNDRVDTWNAFVMDVPPETTDYAWAWRNKTRPVGAQPPTGLGARSYQKTNDS